MVEKTFIDIINNLTEEVKTLDNTNKVYLQTLISLGKENESLQRIIEKYRIQLKILSEQRDYLKDGN